MNTVQCFFEFYDFARRQLDVDAERLFEFCRHQWPIVERAIYTDEGYCALDSLAHDLTCSFVERVLFNRPLD